MLGISSGWRHYEGYKYLTKFLDWLSQQFGYAIEALRLSIGRLQSRVMFGCAGEP
jgi:hypothetical protein